MISVAVMAHPARSGMVDELVEAVDAPVTVVWDRKNNEWDTGRRALDAYDRHAHWHVVLQDDALVCADLTAGLTHALGRVPVNSAVSLYVGKAKPFKGRVARMVRAATEQGCSWVTLHQLHWGVGVALPVPFLDEIVWRGDRTRVLEYDRRLSTVFRKMSMPVWYTVPSLCDHRDGPSLLRHDGTDRRAHGFNGVGWSALDTQWWTGPVLHPPTSQPRQEPRNVSGQPRSVEQ